MFKREWKIQKILLFRQQVNIIHSSKKCLDICSSHWIFLVHLWITQLQYEFFLSTTIFHDGLICIFWCYNVRTMCHKSNNELFNLMGFQNGFFSFWKQRQAFIQIVITLLEFYFEKNKKLSLHTHHILLRELP